MRMVCLDSGRNFAFFQGWVGVSSWAPCVSEQLLVSTEINEQQQECTHIKLLSCASILPYRQAVGRRNWYACCAAKAHTDCRGLTTSDYLEFTKVCKRWTGQTTSKALSHRPPLPQEGPSPARLVDSCFTDVSLQTSPPHRIPAPTHQRPHSPPST